MTQLKRTIIYMIVFCLIFLGLSYLVSVNRELVFYSANSAWISNKSTTTPLNGAATKRQSLSRADGPTPGQTNLIPANLID